MSRKLQVKRGKKANLPTLAEGEFGFLTDKKKLYIGSDSGNVKIPTGDGGLPVVNITSTDGVAYTGELPELYEGLTIIVIPNRSTNIPSGSLPTLNEVAILPSDLATNKIFLGSDLYPEGFFKSGIPSTITYYKRSDDEYIWKTVGVGVYSAKKLIGALPITKGGTGATTKEGAQENLGILPIIDARSANYDMDAVLKSDYHQKMFTTNGETLGTPFKKGTISGQEALILSYASGATYGEQVAFVAGGGFLFRKYENGVIGDWDTYATTSDLAKYLPLTGGTLSGASVLLNGGTSRIIDNVQQIQIETMNNANDYSKRRLLTIKTSMHQQPDIEKALSLRDISENAIKTYNIFGEHNTSLLASAIQNLIQNGGLSTLGRAIRITSVALGVDSTSTFSGNGKGKLFIQPATYSVVPTITIDGASIGEVKTNGGYGIEIEFLTSFKVASSASQYCYCNAVFY